MAEMAGLLKHDGDRVDSIQAEKLLHQLQRGTGNGIVLLGEAALIHTRLKPVTMAERQPVQNADGTMCATVLGQPQWGESHRHAQDPLVPRELLEFYQARGPAAFRYLWGQWAAAIWDAPRQRLVLARGWEGSPQIWMAERDDTFTYSTSASVFDPKSQPPQELDTQETRLLRIRRATPVMA
ncbi:class II glutamine amidotransferase domain-containing protein [Thalassoroseus pseudoceratinae]|uniref:hypothetical protein n=1 Tax=Thalassoroseus pseudoceratinae TaxID=2713176 RepID=UPI001420B1B4|nr:hypothetical protein [Thalassoroseus pseudoceratinae]